HAPDCWFTQTSFVSSQLSEVHELVSLQSRAGPAAHMPFWHVSVTVQNAPSSQVVPLVTAGKTQPLAGLQEFVVQVLLSSHVRGGPGVHPPAPSQMSPFVQALLSVHAPPAVT